MKIEISTAAKTDSRVTTAFKEFLEFRQSAGKSIKVSTLREWQGKLQNIPAEDALAVINRSLYSGWYNLYFEK